MKKIIALLAVFMLALGTLPALCQEAYPQCMGTVTDLALVLQDNTISDLEKLNQRYQDKTDGQLYVVTRHFLGGRDAKEYAGQLFSAWNLRENDALVLMVIGEETSAMHLGKKAAAALPNEAASALFSTHFHDAFMAREYDKAAGDVCTQVLCRLAASQGETLNTEGLFGSTAQSSALHVYQQELSHLFSTFFEEEQQDEKKDENHVSVLREDKSTGISIWKILLVVFILRAIFKKKKKKKRRFIF